MTCKMPDHTIEYLDSYDKSYLKLNPGIEDAKRIEKRVKFICENPEHFKPLKHDLKGKRRAHVGHSIVIIYEFKKDDPTIIFYLIKHRDTVYKKR